MIGFILSTIFWRLAFYGLFEIIKRIAGRQAAAVGLLVRGFLFLTEQLIKGQTNYSAWIIYCVIMCTMELSRFFNLRKKRVLINGTIMLVCSVIFLVLYARSLV